MAHNTYDPQAALAEWLGLRQQMAWTQTQVAQMMSLDQGTISHWENRKTPVPPWALRFMRLLVSAQGKASKEKTTYHYHDAVFVMVQVLPTTFRCWHAPRAEAEVMGPYACDGVRVQFTVLLPPKPRKPHRRAQTVTCERHARDALFWLQKYYKRQRVHEDAYDRLWAYRWEGNLVRLDQTNPEVEIRR